MAAISISSIQIGTRLRIVDSAKVEELMHSIQEIGLLQPIVITKENKLIAGAHRLEACKRLNWQEIPFIYLESTNQDKILLAEIDENLVRNELTVIERGDLLRDRKKLLEKLGLCTTNGGDRKTQNNPKNDDKNQMVSDTICEKPMKSFADLTSQSTGLSPRTIRKDMEITDKIDKEIKPILNEKLKNKSITEKEIKQLNAMPVAKQKQVMERIQNGDAKSVKEVVQVQRREDLQSQQQAINEGKVDLPKGLYEILSVDPPWPYGTDYDPETRRAASPYPEMSLEAIKKIKLPSTDDSILFLWTTHKFMRYSFEILDLWGYRDVSIITWVKDRMGLGTWLRSQSEFCIMAVKGKPKINLTNQTTIINGKLREHSRKPDEFYTMVDQLCLGRKLDYFSREQRKGWDCMGNDTQKFSE